VGADLFNQQKNGRKMCRYLRANCVHLCQLVSRYKDFQPCPCYESSLFGSLLSFRQSRKRGTPNVTFGHIHINSADPSETIAFWTEIVGISTWSRNSLSTAVGTLGVLIVIARSAPSGPSFGLRD
jgi:hypothetical protein